MAVYRLASFEGSLKANKAFGKREEADSERIRDAVKEAHAWYTEAGISLVPSGRGGLQTASLALDGATENLSINATDAFNKYLPGSSWQWETGSGVARARGWALNSIVDADDEQAVTSSVDAILSAALPTLEVADALACTAEGHTGVDAKWFFEKNHQRRRGLLQVKGKNRPVVADFAQFAARDLNWVPAKDEHPFWGRPAKK